MAEIIIIKYWDAKFSKSSPPCEGASSILASGTNGKKGTCSGTLLCFEHIFFKVAAGRLIIRIYF